jgi:hypothetical protein
MRERDPTYVLANYEQILAPPVPVADLPTFDPRVRRPLSPQLRERQIRSSHESLREHFEGSPPNMLRDDQLTLFGMLDRGGGASDGVIYLSWKDGAVEPELFWMSGMSSEFYDDLHDYLKWCNES